jgi:hypothetical protein
VQRSMARTPADIAAITRASARLPRRSAHVSCRMRAASHPECCYRTGQAAPAAPGKGDSYRSPPSRRFMVGYVISIIAAVVARSTSPTCTCTGPCGRHAGLTHHPKLHTAAHSPAQAMWQVARDSAAAAACHSWASRHATCMSKRVHSCRNSRAAPLPSLRCRPGQPLQPQFRLRRLRGARAAVSQPCRWGGGGRGHLRHAAAAAHPPSRALPAAKACGYPEPTNLQCLLKV